MCSAVVLQVTEPTSEVPDHIRPNHLIKELTKEIRYLEVRGKEEGRIYDIYGAIFVGPERSYGSE